MRFGTPIGQIFLAGLPTPHRSPRRLCGALPRTPQLAAEATPPCTIIPVRQGLRWGSHPGTTANKIGVSQAVLALARSHSLLRTHSQYSKDDYIYVEKNPKYRVVTRWFRGGYRGEISPPCGGLENQPTSHGCGRRTLVGGSPCANTKFLLSHHPPAPETPESKHARCPKVWLPAERLTGWRSATVWGVCGCTHAARR